MSGDNAKPFVAIRQWLRAGLLRHLSPTASKILFLVVDHAHKDGYSYPSAQLLSRESGHPRKRIYAALEELVSVGCIQRKEGAEGRTRFKGGNHPGPVYYWIAELDDRTRERLSRKPSRKSTRGDVTRFTRLKRSQTQEHLTKLEMSLRQEHLERERCPNQSPTDVPKNVPRDVPKNAQLMSLSQEHIESFKSKKPRVFEESSPIPSLGECPIPEQVRSRAISSSSLKRDEKPKSATNERRRDWLRQFFLNAHTYEKLESLDYYRERFFHNQAKDYPPEMIAEVYGEVVRKINGGAHG